jgi:hypothetical protein
VLATLAAEETTMLRAIIASCPGNPYETPVTEEALRRGFGADPDAVDDLLDALEAKGVIASRRGGRVQLVY